MKKKQHPWNIGDKFFAPKWDVKTIYEVDRIGPDYIQSTQPGTKIKIRFNKTTIIPLTTHEQHTS